MSFYHPALPSILAFIMLKLFFENLVNIVNGLKTAERRLLFFLLICAVIFLTIVITKMVSSSKEEDQLTLESTKIEYNIKVNDLQKRCDNCEDARFQDKLEQIEKLEVQTHRQDSLLEILRNIK